MNAKEKLYFEELTKIRSKGAELLSQSFLSGIWEGIVEKYSDQAHFIYELLQNADDVGAKYAEFTLYEDSLVFRHNGTRHFHVTNPNTEKEDKQQGKLGDLNSISSAAQSSKKGTESIGKFGVGFKAVFQYTDTPYIYDPNICFKINNYIVPEALDNDYPGRKEEETIFVFPFNNKTRTSQESFEDIFDKLRHLVYPTLFLNHLENVSINVPNQKIKGFYKKQFVQTKSYGDTVAHKIELSYSEDEIVTKDNLWLFSKKDESNHDYYVGFFLSENEKLKATDLPAFCFFPTKEETKLHFIVHAPFLLTDSREGIKAGDVYNRHLISLLADLSAEALLHLCEIGKENNIQIIDDDVINIVPINENDFSALNDKTKISFLPFYDSIKSVMQEGLLPSRNGYVSQDNAYWSQTIDICSLFTDSQLGQLMGNKDACWVFCSKARHAFDSYGNSTIKEYIDDLVCDWIEEKDFFNKIDSSFIEQQPIEWLHKFYKWISDTPRRFTNNLVNKPIFLNEDGKAVAAYDVNGQKTLFLPSENVEDCPTINSELLNNDDTKAFLLDVVKLEEPSLKDYIYNTIIPNYKVDDGDPFNYFKLFFSYYKECTASEVEEYISEIKDLDFLEYLEDGSDGEEQYYCRSKACDLYFPTEKLTNYFSAKQNVHFLVVKQYTDEFPNDSRLISFLNALGIMNTPKTYEHELSSEEKSKYPDLPHERSTGKEWYSETRIDGALELAKYISQNNTKELSVLLWSYLLDAFAKNPNISSNGRYHYFYRTSHLRIYQSIMSKALHEEKWLVDKDGNFVSASEITIADLDSNYETVNETAQVLIEFLDFIDDESDRPVSDEEKLGKLCKKFGLESEEDLLEFIEWKKQKDNLNAAKDNSSNDSQQKEQKNTVDSIAKELSQRAKQEKSKEEDLSNHTDEENSQHDSDETDRDEFMPGAIDYASKIESQKEKQAVELQELAQMQELQDLAIGSDKYTFVWFKTLLDMEILNSDVDSSSNREINISFGKIEKEEGMQKTYILRHPNKYIPQYMEDLSDIPLLIHMKDGTSKSVAIEVSSVQSYTLHVKLKDANSLSGLDLSEVQEIVIKASRPVFLLQALKEKVATLHDENNKILSDDFNIRDNLPENIEFVFGPPGTGKTTYLADKVLVPLMQENECNKVLVLAPTNKAADVITTRIMDVMNDDTSYTEWLTRFGITADERIENNNIFREKTFDLRSFARSVTVTTIARFAYDFFMPNKDRLYLDELNWDYIVIDEASMIPAVQIIYPLMKKTPKKFIIAGDPFQIEPITTVDLWADENIYKLVELNSFTNPTTVPYDYPVVKLTTQYRSIPEIGEIFSNFTYGGILQHYRSSNSRRDLHLDGIMDIESLNIIKFPVSKFESIYRSKRLNGTTPYQIYSAIFTMEYINYLSGKLSIKNPGKQISIGVIAPYKAQASLIDRLLSSVSIPDEIKVQTGTIHGFQGDECDIIFVVLNTPPGISSNPNLFLNKQNILNVAISRAKDYLFVVMPDDQTENIFKLQKIKRVEDLMRASGHIAESTTNEIEKTMFGDDKYIENNAFATSHQLVNVYGQPEKRYEIRSEDTAVDVQLHTIKNEITVSKQSSEEKLPSNEIDSKIKIGDEAKHKKYGTGTITSIEEVNGAYNLVVRFASGEKRFSYHPDLKE